MNPRKRAVDRAMHVDRPEKHTVRELWLQEARRLAEEHPNDDVPLYVTLSGAEAKDIELLVENGLIRVSETNAVIDEDQGKVVAIESSDQAILALQNKFPALRILAMPFSNLIHGGDPFAWPTREEERRCCRARIVNLDLNEPLLAKDREGEIVFPAVAWIVKLSQLHSVVPRRDWTLCLTLHGELPWDESVCTFVHRFLNDNFRLEPRFRDRCEQLFGPEAFEALNEGSPVNFGALPRSVQQRVLMVVVPKLIARRVQNHGWRIATERNLRYGGNAGTAPMVTWVMRFAWDAEALASPDQAYREALVDIFSAVGSISDDGRVQNG